MINGLQLGVERARRKTRILGRSLDGIERPGWSEISDKSPFFKALWAQWDSLRVENGLLKLPWENPDGRHVTMQLVIPADATKEPRFAFWKNCRI